MDTQTILNVVGGAACAMLGWIVRVIWEAQQTLRKDLQKLEQQLPETYVRRDDWKDQLREIKEMLNKIFDRLDGKADKE